jgi:hypothetical protein
VPKCLLDEGLSFLVLPSLRETGLDVDMLPEQWRALADGELLRLARRNGFHVLITTDKNLPFQNNLVATGMSVLVVNTNSIARLSRHADLVRSAVESLGANDYARVDIPE